LKISEFIVLITSGNYRYIQQNKIPIKMAHFLLTPKRKIQERRNGIGG